MMILMPIALTSQPNFWFLTIKISLANKNIQAYLVPEFLFELKK
jgi:hypothetical protein